MILELFCDTLESTEISALLFLHYPGPKSISSIIDRADVSKTLDNFYN
jgi:hypothetical protein